MHLELTHVESQPMECDDSISLSSLRSHQIRRHNHNVSSSGYSDLPFHLQSENEHQANSQLVTELSSYVSVRQQNAKIATSEYLSEVVNVLASRCGHGCVLTMPMVLAKAGIIPSTIAMMIAFLTSRFAFGG